ncbi:MAG: hypothetical protein MJ061_05310, partial [Mailhella sp.]|nr:hypothetical protein [Mailhella sp.]
MADYIAERTGADVYELVPAEPYSRSSYEDTVKRAEMEHDAGARPAIKDAPKTAVSGYDTVFIGSPVWVYDAPMIMYTFYDTYGKQLSGKTVIPFGTAEGSPLSDLENAMRKSLPADVTYRKGKLVRGVKIRSAKDEVL